MAITFSYLDVGLSQMNYKGLSYQSAVSLRNSLVPQVLVWIFTKGVIISRIAMMVAMKRNAQC